MGIGGRVIVALALLMIAVGHVAAQSIVAAGAISGLVVDAETGQPVAGAVLRLRAHRIGSAAAAPTASAALVRSTRSDSSGAYRLADVPLGSYELRTHRIGYRDVVLGVEVVGTTDSRVAVGLAVLPIKLQSVVATPEAINPFAVRTAGAPEREMRARLSAEGARLPQSLSVDVQTLTRAGVTEAITLAEPDLFRALHRNAAVSTRDDISAELWTRGARGDLTRIYFDGVPLFDPHHAFGGLSAVSVDAVGAMYLHPGVAPASFGEGAAGVVDLRSRRGSGNGRVGGVGELSLITARAALDQQMEGGDLAWMVAGRRSHIDWLSRAAAADSSVPYSLNDFTARVDVQLDEDRSVEISGTRIANAVQGKLFGEAEAFSQRWGSHVGQGTFDLPLASGRLRTTGAFTRSSFRNLASSDERADRGAVSMMLIRGEWAASMDSASRWIAGAEVSRQESVFRGRRLVRTDPARPDSLIYRDARLIASTWLARRWVPASGLTAEAMLRAEVSDAAPAALLLSPRGAVRYHLAPGLHASIAAGQSFQHTQAVAPGAPGFRSEPRVQHLWLLAGDTVPRVRSRIATAGLEYSTFSGWLTSATAFVRGIEGLAHADPAPGELVGRRTFLNSETDAHGLEVSARRISPRWTAHGAYTYGRSTTTSGTYRYPSPEQRTHALDGTAMLRMGSSLRLGAAYTTMSGSPFTPYVPAEEACRQPGPCRWTKPPVLGAPGSGRGPVYSRLDLLAEWNGRLRGIRIGAYLQIHNVLGHENDVTYIRECADCGGADERVFSGGVDRGPMIGIRAAF